MLIFQEYKSEKVGITHCSLGNVEVSKNIESKEFLWYSILKVHWSTSDSMCAEAHEIMVKGERKNSAESEDINNGNANGKNLYD